MVQGPLFALGLQPGGCMTIKMANEYLAGCRSSKRRYYRVLVIEAGPASVPAIGAVQDIASWAIARAISSLELCSDATVGIGLQSNRLMFGTRFGIMSVRLAAAALVERGSLEPTVVINSGDTLDAQAKVVAEVLNTWPRKTAQRPNEPIIDQLLKKTLGL